MAKLFLFWVRIHAKIEQQLACTNQLHCQIQSCNPSPCLHPTSFPLAYNVYKLTSSPLHSTNTPTNTRKSRFWFLETEEITNTMSLNCLTCSQLLQRTDSFGELFAENEFKEIKEICKQVDRSWSSNKLPATPKRELPKVSTVAKLKGDHRRNYSTGDVPYPGSSGPKLLRSSGMRRNWSFEDVTETQEQQSMRFH
ncbi:hypothetical protein ACSQ67_003505 [Phaseolus vulgaris]